MKYIASIFVDGVEEAGIVTNMYDRFGDEVTIPAKAMSLVIKCSKGFVSVEMDRNYVYPLQ